MSKHYCQFCLRALKEIEQRAREWDSGIMTTEHPPTFCTNSPTKGHIYRSIQYRPRMTNEWLREHNW